MLLTFNTRNNFLTAKLLKATGITNSVRCRYDMISKFNVGLKSLFKEDLSEPEFYGDLVYNVRKKMLDGMIFSDRSRKIIIRYKRTEKRHVES